MNVQTQSQTVQASFTPKPLSLLAPAERPREKLLSRGEEACSEEELLAVLLRTGSRGVCVLELARGILLQAGGLSKLASLRAGELKQFRGLGSVRAASLIAAMALGRRAAELRFTPGEAFLSASKVYRHFQYRFLGLRKERFWALYLDNRNRLIREELISEGTLTNSLVHPREVFGPALRESAAAMIVLHNHPSGDARPSQEDRGVTQRLAAAGELVGIPLLDHVIVSANGYYSFQESRNL